MQFDETIQQLMKDTMPITINPQSVYLSLQHNHPEDQTDYSESIHKWQDYINQSNHNSFQAIEAISKQILTKLQNDPKITKLDLIQLLANSVDSQFKSIAVLLVELTYQMISQFVADVIEKELNCQEFHEYLTDLLERTMCRMSLEIPQFAKIDSKTLYIALKSFFNQTLQNMHLFIHRCSVHCNSEMENLNELLVQYSSLANVRSYEILQVEKSHFIINLIKLSLKDLYFFRIEFQEKLDQFVTQSIRYFYEYSKLNLGHLKMSTITNSFPESIALYEILFEEKVLTQSQIKDLGDSNFTKYKTWLDQKRQIRSEQMLTNGQLSGALVGGSIGAGIGCLIVDSTDPKMPWNEKLKRAGFSTMSTGLVGAAMRIPVIGILIQQAIIVYAVGYTASNKVVSREQKAKNLAHVSVQSVAGMGSAIAGQILIPIPVLGAIIGGTVGGVAMGLYQKLVVQKNKPSIKQMLEQMIIRLMVDGLVVYDDLVLKTMKISKEFFEKGKPEDFSDSEWLTVLSVYLVNEIYYLHGLQMVDKLEELEEKKKKNEKNEKNLKKLEIEVKQIEKEEEEMEIINVRWERCRIYIQQKGLPTLVHAEKIGTFLNGMLQNFKV